MDKHSWQRITFRPWSPPWRQPPSSRWGNLHQWAQAQGRRPSWISTLSSLTSSTWPASSSSPLGVEVATDNSSDQGGSSSHHLSVCYYASVHPGMQHIIWHHLVVWIRHLWFLTLRVLLSTSAQRKCFKWNGILWRICQKLELYLF